MSNSLKNYRRRYNFDVTKDSQVMDEISGHQNPTWVHSSINRTTGLSSEREYDFQRQHYYSKFDYRRISSHPCKSPRRAKVIGYQNNELHKNEHNFTYEKSDYERRCSRRRDSYCTHSRSSSKSELESENDLVGYVSLKLLLNNNISDAQIKQIRVENWVKSVNKSNWARIGPYPSDKKKTNRGTLYPQNTLSSSKNDSLRKRRCNTWMQDKVLWDIAWESLMKEKAEQHKVHDGIRETAAQCEGDGNDTWGKGENEKMKVDKVLWDIAWESLMKEKAEQHKVHDGIRETAAQCEVKNTGGSDGWSAVSEEGEDDPDDN